MGTAICLSMVGINILAFIGINDWPTNIVNIVSGGVCGYLAYLCSKPVI